MHPEILRELTAQRSRDLRERAYRARMLRTLRRSRRVDRGEEFTVPAIPDYVDGTFRTAGDQADRKVPAGRHAA